MIKQYALILLRYLAPALSAVAHMLHLTSELAQLVGMMSLKASSGSMYAC